MVYYFYIEALHATQEIISIKYFKDVLYQYLTRIKALLFGISTE
jgi:hypothetical protein